MITHGNVCSHQERSPPEGIKTVQPGIALTLYSQTFSNVIFNTYYFLFTFAVTYLTYSKYCNSNWETHVYTVPLVYIHILSHLREYSPNSLPSLLWGSPNTSPKRKRTVQNCVFLEKKESCCSVAHWKGPLFFTDHYLNTMCQAVWAKSRGFQAS